MIAADRAAGYQPFLVVGTAGTVNSGAIDPLAEISEIANREGLWFHVDGAIGALAIFSEKLRHLINGIEASHSIALDFHKCGHVPYDAGFLLVRDGAAHKRAFTQKNSYLQRADRGLAAGETWPCDLGPDLSRGFRALKTWMTIETLGADRMGASMAHTCELANYLADRIRQSAMFELCSDPILNIVCFRMRDQHDSINRELVLDLHESGIAAPSWTEINGKCAIRCAIINHRTTHDDIETFLAALVSLAELGLNTVAVEKSAEARI
jgi:glutamate/tyrosine decarboxylase-like PLP-dependent enzyme